MTPEERAIYQAWVRKYLGHSPAHRLADAMSIAMAGLPAETIYATMDAATIATAALRERAYRRSERRRSLERCT